MTPPTWTHEKAEALKRLCEAAAMDTDEMRYLGRMRASFDSDLCKALNQGADALEALPDALAEIERLTTQVREAETMKVDIEAMRVNLHATFNGGHQFEEARRAFHHGMDTVCNVLAAHQKREQTNGILPPPPAREGSQP